MSLILLSPQIQRADPYRDLVAFLLKGRKAGYPTHTFLDSSDVPKTITRDGEVVQMLDPDGRPAGYFDGNGDRLSVAASADFNLGATYTVEVELRFKTLPPVGRGCRVLLLGTNNTTSAVTMQVQPTGAIVWAIPYGGLANAGVTSSTAIEANRTYRITVAKSGGTVRIYIDGQLDATATMTNQTAGDIPAYVGYDTAAVATVNFQFHGYMQRVHIAKGVDLYSGLTEITTPIAKVAETKLLLDFDAAGIVDITRQRPFYTSANMVSSNDVMHGSEPSLYFDRRSYGLMPYTSEFNLSSPSWTLETFFQLIDLRGQCLFSKDADSQNHDLSVTILYSGRQLRILTAKTTVSYVANFPSQLVAGQKYHLALSRVNGTLYLFLNGVMFGTTLIGFTNESNGPLMVGGTNPNNPSALFYGYMMDPRFTKNVGRYVGGFKPSTVPYTY